MALPEIFLFCVSSALLVIDAFLPAGRRVITYYLAQLALVATFFLVLPQFKLYLEPVVGFSGHYIVDRFAVVAKLFILFFCFFAFSYAKEYVQDRKMALGDFYLLSLLAVLGMFVMVSAHSLLTMYLGLELLSLVLYAIVAMHKESRYAIEAAMKYIILGGLASGLLLYGISLLYGLTGSLQLVEIANALQSYQGVVPVVALVFILSGLLFKLGAVPFHMWVPDVYQGAATPVTLFIASAPKIAAFVILVRVLVQALPNFAVQWEHVLVVVSILSMFSGNLLAIAQTNLKRMFAYSSIAHMGYALLGVLAGPDSTQGYSAAMFYMSTYVLVAAGAFAIIAILSRHGIEFDKLDDYRGLNARHPWLAFMMLLLLFSMAGVPPTVGFIAKLGLLEALVQANYVWLAALALVFALIGAYYYLRVVMLMYFEEPVEGALLSPLVLSKEMFVAISLNGSAALLLGLAPSLFIDMCRLSIG
jgi:NADH-quinone oxidoreductase subunit N